MKQYIKLFEDFTLQGKMPLWSKPHSLQGAIGHNLTDHSFGKYRNRAQSMVSLTPGDKVRCINQESPSYGMIGRIVSFEDATVRWKIDLTETGVGIEPREYRCRPEHLEKI